MYYIIQENLFREEGYIRLLSTMNKFDMDYELVNINSDSEDIIYKTDRKYKFYRLRNTNKHIALKENLK